MTLEQKLTVYCDGGARGNPGPGAAGWTIEIPAENMRFLCGKYLGVVTNNQAEYSAVELALQKILEINPKQKNIQFYLDSLLVVNQLNGLFKVKNPILAERVLNIRSLEQNFKDVSYKHIRREKNTLADSLVNKSLDFRKDFDSKEEIN